MWFEQLMGFAEESPEQVRGLIAVDGEHLVSSVNGRRVAFGRLSTPSLAELRAAAPDAADGPPSTIREVVGNVAHLHADPVNAGALFQAASQFNLLEMVGPGVTPEEGVGIYAHDRTQGPACAIACGGGTIYRNYFAPVRGGLGQTADRQIDCLAELETALGGPGLWEMRNGYALPTAAGLATARAALEKVDEAGRDELRGLLRVGVQHDVEVLGTSHRVTQVYGSATPVAYSGLPAQDWAPVARLVLEASYEATLLQARAAGIQTVFLTLLGGGVFGNPWPWIAAAITQALDRVAGLDARIVSYGRSSPQVRALVAARQA